MAAVSVSYGNNPKALADFRRMVAHYERVDVTRLARQQTQGGEKRSESDRHCPQG